VVVFLTLLILFPSDLHHLVLLEEEEEEEEGGMVS